MYQAQAHAFAFRFVHWPVLLLSLNLWPFGQPSIGYSYYCFHAQVLLLYIQTHAFVSQPCIWIRPFFFKKAQVRAHTFYLLVMHRRMLFLVHTYSDSSPKASIEQGYEPGHRLDTDMTKKQTMIIKHEF